MLVDTIILLMSNKKPYFLGNLLSKNKKAKVKPFNNRRMVLEEILKELKKEQRETKDYIWRGTAIYSSMYKMLRELIANDKQNN